MDIDLQLLLPAGYVACHYMIPISQTIIHTGWHNIGWLLLSCE